MKIFGVINNYDSTGTRTPDRQPDYFLIPDSALLRSGKPFFIPGGDDLFKACPSIVIKIDRLGKGIAPKFASRYYNEVALGIVIYASRRLQELKEQGKPLTPALAFDYNAPVSDFRSKETLGDNFRFSLSLSGSEEKEWEMKHLISPVDEIVSQISRYNTLRTGDLIFAGLADFSIELEMNKKLAMILDGEEIYHSNIK